MASKARDVADLGNSVGVDDNATSTAITIDASENVGINDTNPFARLTVGAPNSGDNLTLGGFYANSGATGGNSSQLKIIAASDLMRLQTGSNDALSFETALTERLRIDASGNVIIGGTTYQGSATSGASSGYLTPNGFIAACVNNDFGMLVNRTGTDGTAFQFRKDGSNVGSIGSQATGTLYIDTASGFGVLKSSGTNIFVWSTAAFYPEADNARDLGTASKRFDDVYATNGTIQTSDRNEKQDIAALTTAEITAAKAISAGFKTFKWNDSVAEKGAEARTHSGVIAQEVEQALTDAGLDAGDYAFFISNTWWETHTEVPAVEAVAEVLDAEGVVITEAVEAKEAYTRTDTYHTLAEAPEGATERTRKGIRYPQLLAFVGAATEQRLASIEARLTALEVTP